MSELARFRESITAALGVMKPVSDPRNLTAPGVLIGMPQWRHSRPTPFVSLTVTAVAPGPGDMDAGGWLVGAADRILDLLGARHDVRATECVPTSYERPDMALPAYRIVITAPAARTLCPPDETEN